MVTADDTREAVNASAGQDLDVQQEQRLSARQHGGVAVVLFRQGKIDVLAHAPQPRIVFFLLECCCEFYLVT